MALLTLRGIRKAFGGRELFDSISLNVLEGERIGLIGPNGAGKTTLLKIIAGLEEPDEGERALRKGLRLAFLEQEPHLDAAAPIRDIVRAGLKGEEAEHEVERMISRVGLADPDVLCGNLSGGERRRVALAQVLLEDPDLLLLDEPTNHLDAFVTQWLEELLIGIKMPLLMVTHDRYFLDRVTSRIVELDRGELHSYEGGYLAFLDKQGRRLSAERKGEATRKNLLRRESEWIRRGPQGRATKAKARIQRHDVLVESKKASLPEELVLEIPPGPRLGKKVFELKGVTKAPLFSDLDLEIGGRERIGIVGPNGVGKTTLLKILLEELEPDSGTISRGETVEIAYIDQTRAELDENKSVLREISGGHSSVKIGTRLVRIESFLAAFLFDAAQFPAPVGMLSGGERNRVLLAKLMLKGGNVLVLDEPTNDLDLMTLRVLEEALVAFPGTVLVVTHDRYFLDRVATRILYLDGKGGVREWPADMTALLDQLKQERSAAKPRKKREARERVARPGNKRTYAEQIELDALPDRIAVAEAAVTELDARLADPEVYARPDVGEIIERRKREVTELDRLYARWEELESKDS